jgi:hypothetical protein
MRVVILAGLVTCFIASLAFAQAGPKQKEKARQKKESVEKADAPKQDEPARVQPAEPQDEPAETMQKMPPGDEMASSGPLRRALFTTAIETREPIDRVDSLSTSTELVYFFTELIDLQGQTVTHRWKYRDEVKAEVPIAVGAPRWRAYSSKKLLPAWTGDWTVEVVDSSGAVLGARHLIYYRAD